MLHYMERTFFDELNRLERIAVDENGGAEAAVHAPKPLTFAPYAFQTNMSRAAIRANPALRRLHEFLINETAIVSAAIVFNRLKLQLVLRPL